MIFLVFAVFFKGLTLVELTLMTLFIQFAAVVFFEVVVFLKTVVVAILKRDV